MTDSMIRGKIKNTGNETIHVISQNGFLVYSATETFKKNEVIEIYDSNIGQERFFVSKIDNNVGNDPLTDATNLYWDSLTDNAYGISLYSINTTYKKNDLIKYYDSDNNKLLIYYSKTDNNKNNNPLTDKTNWGTTNISFDIIYNSTFSYKKNDIVARFNERRQKFLLYVSTSADNVGYDPEEYLTNNKWYPIAGLDGLDGITGNHFLGEIITLGLGLADREDNNLRILNGETVLPSLYPDFITRLKKVEELYPGTICSEDEWQKIKRESALGQCGKFVYNDGTQVKLYAWKKGDEKLYTKDTNVEYNKNIYDKDENIIHTGSIGQINTKAAKVGSPIVSNDYLLSETAGGNGYVIPAEDIGLDTSKYWEIKVKFKITTLNSGSNVVMSYGSANNYGIAFFQEQSSKMSIWISSTGTTWDVASSSVCSTVVQANKDYWYKIYWDGVAYKGDISSDGVNYLNDFTITSNKQLFSKTKLSIMYGAYSTAQKLNGSIDLKEFSISNYGNIIFEPITDKTKLFYGVTEYTRDEDNDIKYDAYLRLPCVKNIYNGLTLESMTKIDTTLAATGTVKIDEKVSFPYAIVLATSYVNEESRKTTIDNNPLPLLDYKYSNASLMSDGWVKSESQYNTKATYEDAYLALEIEQDSTIAIGTQSTIKGKTYTKRGLSVKLKTEEYTDYDFVLNKADESFRLPIKTEEGHTDNLFFYLYNAVRDLDLANASGVLTDLAYCKSKIDSIETTDYLKFWNTTTSYSKYQMVKILNKNGTLTTFYSKTDNNLNHNPLEDDGTNWSVSVINLDDDIGDIKLSSASVAPDGWYKCDGSVRSKTDDPDLYSKLGYTFGKYYKYRGWKRDAVTNYGAIKHNDGILSGFNSNVEYAIADKLFQEGNSQNLNKFEIVVKFKATNIGTTQNVFNISPQTTSRSLIVRLSGSKIHCWMTTVFNESGWNIANDASGSYTMSSNTWYWFKLSYNGTSYIAEISVDGISYTPYFNITSANKVHSGYLLFGSNGDAYDESGLYIDLNECYFKTNSDTVKWRGVDDNDFLTLGNNTYERKYNHKQIGTLTQKDYKFSGFSTSNYLILNDGKPFEISATDRFEVVGRFYNWSIGTHQTLFATNSYGFSLGVYSSKIILYLSSNGTSWNITNYSQGWSTLYNNKWYWFKFGYNGGGYYVNISTDGINWKCDCFIASLVTLSSGKQIYCGRNIDASSQPFSSGTVDLASCYINKIASDDTVTNWWKGINGTIVDKPLTCPDVGASIYSAADTLTTTTAIHGTQFGSKLHVAQEDGIITTDDSNTYLSIGQKAGIDEFDIEYFRPGNNSWEIKTGVISYSIGTNQWIFGPNAQYQGPGLRINSSKLNLALSSNGTSYDISNLVASSTALVADKKYDIKVSYDKTQYKVDVSEDGGTTWVNHITVTSTTPIYNKNAYLRLGLAYDATAPVYGQIDVKNSYIKIGTDIVWSGKQQLKVIKSWDNGFEDNANHTYWLNDTKSIQDADKFYLPKYDNRQLIEKKIATDQDPTWYNIYSDGWCEQGGITTNFVVTNGWYDTKITLLKPYKNTNYNKTVTGFGTYDGYNGMAYKSITEESFITHMYKPQPADGTGLNWQTEGYLKNTHQSSYIIRRFKKKTKEPAGKYDENTTYKHYDMVWVSTSSDTIKYYFSNSDDNKGNTPSDVSTYWTAVEEEKTEQNFGIEEFSFTKTYNEKDIVKVIDPYTKLTSLYSSLVDNNVNHNPELDTSETYWKLTGGKEGITEWSNTRTYKEKDIVYVYDSAKREMKVYYSTSNNNVGHNPTVGDGSYWKVTTMLNEWWDSSITYPKNYIVKINNTITYNEYSSTTTYSKNNIIYVNDGGTNKYYISLIDGNVGNDPLTDDGTHWKSIGNPGNDVMLLYKSLEDGNINNNPITSPDKWVQVLNSQINNMVPSGKYIDLTLGASGTEYTAPANGWFAMSISVTAPSCWIYLISSNKIMSNLISPYIGTGLYIYLPVAKGEKVTALFTADKGVVSYFRFIYSTNQ